MHLLLAIFSISLLTINPVWAGCGLFSSPVQLGSIAPQVLLPAGHPFLIPTGRSEARKAPEGSTVQFRDSKGKRHEIVIFDNDGIGANGFHAWGRPSNKEKDIHHFQGIDRPITPVRVIQNQKLSWSEDYFATISKDSVYIWQVFSERPHGGHKPFAVIAFPEEAIRPERVLLIDGHFTVILNDGSRTMVRETLYDMKGSRFEEEKCHPRIFLLEPRVEDGLEADSDLRYSTIQSFRGMIHSRSVDSENTKIEASVIYDSEIAPLIIEGRYQMNSMENGAVPISIVSAEITLPNGETITSRQGDVSLKARVSMDGVILVTVTVFGYERNMGLKEGVKAGGYEFTVELKSRGDGYRGPRRTPVRPAIQPVLH